MVGCKHFVGLEGGSMFSLGRGKPQGGGLELDFLIKQGSPWEAWAETSLSLSLRKNGDNNTEGRSPTGTWAELLQQRAPWIWLDVTHALKKGSLGGLKAECQVTISDSRPRCRCAGLTIGTCAFGNFVNKKRFKNAHLFKDQQLRWLK